MNINEIISTIEKEIKQPLWSNWYIKERIGSGAFSAVYRIEAKRLNRTDVSALKIEPIIADDTLFWDEERKKSHIERKRSLAENESEIMYKLKGCQHIVAYEDEDVQKLIVNGQFEGYYFLIRMELLSCVSNLIRDKKMDLSESSIIKLAKHIGLGIKAAHDKNIIHRDIKPSNFFLSDDGIYKLGDFNVSKPSETARTFAGTPGYLAPEIYRAKSNVDESYTKQADIYSFGICLYQFMSSGYLPFEENCMTDTAIDKRMNGERFSKPKYASEEFSRVILKACAYDVNDRYRTIDEMLSDLDTLNDMSISQKIESHQKSLSDDNYRTVYADVDVDTTKEPCDNKRATKSFLSWLFTAPKYNTEEFEIENGVLKKYKGKNKCITIPDNVTSIGDRAFMDCDNLTSIIIPDSVISIRELAFADCANLTNITIPNSVTSIGWWAFRDCKNLTNITIPNSVTSIGTAAFEGCANLTNIIIPNGVPRIEVGTFSNCKNLTNITIPNSVTSIGDCAFSNCQNLTNVTIPNSVTSIGEWAFSDCKNLTNVTIPNSVTSIEDHVFSDCKNLTNITIPNGVTSIEEWTFSHCENLTNVTIPNSVTSIGEWAFSDCKNLTNVTIPNSVTSIGDGAFCSCNNLTNITIPNSVKSIGKSLFFGCKNLHIEIVDTTLELPESERKKIHKRFVEILKKIDGAKAEEYAKKHRV